MDLYIVLQPDSKSGARVFLWQGRISSLTKNKDFHHSILNFYWGFTEVGSKSNKKNTPEAPSGTYLPVVTIVTYTEYVSLYSPLRHSSSYTSIASSENKGVNN